MREHTNLAWPEAPFGGDQRPFGKPARILAAVTVEWTCDDSGERLPMRVAAVYLRTRRARTLQIDPDTLNVGFRVVVLDEPSELSALVDLFDRTLVASRRHAVALVGHGLADDLNTVADMVGRRLPGVTGVSLAWADRASKGRGMARMVDTRHDLDPASTGRVDVPLEVSADEALPTSPRCADIVAQASLTQCLAVALTAAWHLGAYRWDGAFADRLYGHQFTSDLAVLAASAGKSAAPAVAATRGAWRARRSDDPAERWVIDTRYDVDHIAGCTSRRLVDVCTALGLDVAQPELRGSSMTAMHRDWLDTGADELRERITVLNLRHSLSTGLVALRAAGCGRWDGVLNVNRLLHAAPGRTLRVA